MKKCEKGCYGYRNYHRKIQLGKVCFGAAMILIQLGARAFTDSTTLKTILTVMAILSVLPTANVASPLLASWKYKTPSEELKKRVDVYQNRGTILYDLIITTKESIMPMEAIMVHPTGVYCYCTASKLDVTKAERFFKEMFVGNKLEVDVRVILDEKVFFHRLETLKSADEYEEDGSEVYVVGLLKSLSM